MTQTQQDRERLYTRFLIYTTPDNGRNLKLEGDVQASSRDQALRRFFEAHGALDDGVTVLATVSENGIKLHIPAPRITLGPPEESKVGGTASDGATGRVTNAVEAETEHAAA